VISQCANPGCSAPFRYLREGKLFQLYTDPEPGTGERTETSRRIEYYWLCGRCAATITLLFEHKDGTVRVHLKHPGESGGFMPANEAQTIKAREIPLNKDDRDLLELLKFELDFLESGGYGRSVHTPQVPTRPFQDSITCINYGDPLRSRPCEECLLMQFVPESRQHEDVPCHHIPLTEKGETVETLEARGNQAVLEEAMIHWLRAAIRRLEQDRALALAAKGV
jgi:hypothetical protein